MGNDRLAIITTHPVQYHGPWFRWITENTSLQIRAFYLWDAGQQPRHDPGFGHSVAWDVPLLDGYESVFVPNTSTNPGTDRFFGIRNPELQTAVRRFAPDAALLIGYRYASMMQLILTPSRRRGYPLLFRGDSHRLGGEKADTLKSETLKRRVRRWAIAQVYRRFAAFLYVGQANREYFKLHGVPDEKLFHAPHAVDNERFMQDLAAQRAAGLRWRENLGVPSNHQLILFAGKFEEKKRPLDLLAAFGRLHRADVSLLFVGAGKLEDELRAHRAERMPNVFFAPFQNQGAMPRTYAAGDLFVLPSFGREETWGLAVNEAMCLARPVIVSTHVGCAADLVRPGINGSVFPAGDVDALTRVLSEALSDPLRLRRWGEASREIVRLFHYSESTKGLCRAVAAATKADVGCETIRG